MGPGANGNNYYGQSRPGNWQQEPQHSIESPEAVFSPQNQNSAPPYAQTSAQSAYDAQQAAAAAAHQQQQRGVSQLTNAVATLGHPPRNAQTPTPGAQGGLNGGQNQGNPEKRGPVEFNHAISYVNKIKASLQPVSVCAILTYFIRTVSKIDLKFISNSSRSSKHISVNQSQFRMFMHRSLFCSTRPLIFWKTLSSSCQNQLLKRRLLLLQRPQKSLL
jgi:hypothetical protein